MTNTEMWLDETISHIKSVKSDIWMLHEIMSLPNCNDCKNKDCKYKPKWGEHIRYNCPLHTDRKTEKSSEKPNNCEHITEDGVTCAKYPACDYCLDNPLNKVKGSERLLKGSEQTDCLDRYDRKTEPTISKMEQVDKDINVRSKDEPQTDCSWK